MNDKVDLVVVGVTGDISRSDMSQKLEKKFGQTASTFEALLDGAYGESAPYVAQTDVERSLAEEGKDQLESLGLICSVLSNGEKPGPVPDTSVQSSAAPDADTTDSALASFKADDSETVDAESDTEIVSFDVDEIDAEDGALASFKRDTKKDKKPSASAADFSDDLDAFDEDAPAIGLMSAKKAKVDVAAIDDSVNHDFSDQIEDVGADQLDAGLEKAQSAKPDFDADVTEVDFSGDIGIHEEDSVTPEVTKSKLEEESTDRNLNSFPKEDTEASVDFSDELEILSSDAPPLAAESGGAKNPADVPEALADGASDDLQADLIDPAPIEKENKESVELDDGGLSLSTNDDAPLTAVKEKSNSEVVDDGGLSLSTDDSTPLTTPKKQVDVQEPDDGGLSLSADSAEVQPVDDAKLESEEAVNPAPDTVSPQVASVEATSPETVTSPEQSSPEAEIPNVEESVESHQATVDPVEPDNVAEGEQPEELKTDTTETDEAKSGGLVLPGQLSNTVVPKIVPEDKLESDRSVELDSLRAAELSGTSQSSGDKDNINQDDPAAAQFIKEVKKQAKEQPTGKRSKTKIAAAIAGVAVLVGAGTFAFMNAGSISPISDGFINSQADVTTVEDATNSVKKVQVEVAELQPGADLENLSTGELLVNLSNNDSSGIVDLEPYFIESGNAVRRGPRIGAAVPAESERMIRNRQSHPADKYFDDWSTREADLSLFLALLDNLIQKGDLEVAQQLSDRAKDKLFAVMSSQRLARAYSDVGENARVTQLMALATRDTYAIKAPEERVLALSDYAFTEQAIGLNEDAMDTFLKTSILARSLGKPETKVVGMSSAAPYFHRSGRTAQAQELLEQSLQAANDLPKNSAARDLAIRYIALSEARMGLFNQALKHTKLIVDPIATVSAYHGIALAIESTGDNNNARKVLNKAYRAGSLIEDKQERSKLLSKVVLASESD